MDQRVRKAREAMIEYHEKTAAKFDRQYREMENDPYASAFAYGRRKLDTLLIEALKDVPQGGHVLDIGCGTGAQLALCQGLGFDVTGIDPSGEMRAIASRHNRNVPVLDGSILSLPFKDETYDFVMSIEVLRYLRRVDVMQAYREMIRVLRPSGRLFFTMVNRYALDGFYIYHNLRRILSRIRRSDALHCEFVTPGRVKSDLVSLGLSDIVLQGRMFGPMRQIFKIGGPLGSPIARRIEPFDDRVSHLRWTVSLASHLVAGARRG